MNPTREHYEHTDEQRAAPRTPRTDAEVQVAYAARRARVRTHTEHWYPGEADELGSTPAMEDRYVPVVDVTATCDNVELCATCPARNTNACEVCGGDYDADEHYALGHPGALM